MTIASMAAVLAIVCASAAHATPGKTMTEDNSTTFEIDDQAGVLRLHTVSNGCTKPEDFSIARLKDGEYSVVRERKDRCRRKPFSISFDYPLNEIAEDC